MSLGVKLDFLSTLSYSLFLSHISPPSNSSSMEKSSREAQFQIFSIFDLLLDRWLWLLHATSESSIEEHLKLGAAAICPDDPVLSVEDLCDQILEVLNYFRLGSVMCMGAMAGVYILKLFAIKYRDRVTGLILVSPLCKAPSWTEWLYNKVEEAKRPLRPSSAEKTRSLNS
ncbi:hypothetical protein QVD17_38471 [Tagetes erecta]|uniref:Uncharacterized protein n=1 Tax=Tagetes erecta TaxID=13708 RepID=A0AAD8NGA1_TARER|nr:hypothetical protein QVD17_38471 [Tagetes erecta]